MSHLVYFKSFLSNLASENRLDDCLVLEEVILQIIDVIEDKSVSDFCT